MRVAVFSDTHGSLESLPAALKKLGEVDAFLHLGDFSSDAQAIANVLNVPYYAVRGNCDVLPKHPGENVVELDGVRLLLVHGDRFRDVYSLALRAEEQHCKAVLFGHTHQPLLTAQGEILIINPGSLSRPMHGSRASCALLTIENGDIDVDILPVLD